MKRLLSLILIFALGLNLCMFTYAEDQNANISNFKEEKEFLKLLDISGSSVLDKAEIARGEFVAYTVNLLYPDNIFDSKEAGADILFSDVDATHSFYDEIRAAKSLGIISGTADMSFKPDENITFNDAVVVMVNALGYSYYAQANGGYPTGYLFTASQIDLTKGITNVSGALTGNVMAKLVYNAFFVDEVVIDGVSKDGTNLSIRPDSNLLSSKYDIYKYDAQVVRTFISSIDGEGAMNDETVSLKLGEGKKITAFTGNTGIEYELGKKLTVYVKNNEETGKNEVVAYQPFSKSQEIQITSTDIINITNTYIEYEKEYGDYVKLKTEISPIVIFNGVCLFSYDNSVLSAEDSILTFIDNDGNGIYEIISILSFNFKGNLSSYGIPLVNNPAWNVVADRIDTVNKLVTCKFNPSNNIRLNEDEAIYTVVSTGGDIRTLEALEENDIISVALAPNKVDGKNYYILYVSRNERNEILTSYNKNDNELYFDNEILKVSSSIYKIKSGYTNNLTTNTGINVYLDATGKVAYMGNLTGSSNNYAYLISAAVRNSSEDYLVVKVLEKTGNVATYNVSEKVKIDGISYKGKSATDAYNALVKRPEGYGKWIKDDNGTPGNFNDDTYYENEIRRPLIIKVDADGIITEIDTDTRNYAKITSGKVNLYSSQNPIGYSDDEMADSDALKAGYRSYRTMDYRTSVGSYEGRFFITSNTYVFSVPDIDTCGFNDIQNYASSSTGKYNTPVYDILKKHEAEISDGNYKVIPASSLVNETVYDIQAYNIDPDTGVADLVILRGHDGMAADPETSSNVAVFLRKTSYYDEVLDKQIEKIYYTSDGINEASVAVDRDSLLFAFDYIIYGRGANDTDNVYGVEIPALKPGDLIRIKATNGYLNTIQRFLILDHLESAYSSIGASYTFYGYTLGNSSRRLYDANEASFGGNTASTHSFIVVPKTIKGDVIFALMGRENISITSPSSYVELFFTTGGVKPLLITIKNSGVEVKEGSLSDIKTIDDCASVSEASRLIYKHNSYKTTQLIIINDERGI